MKIKIFVAAALLCGGLSTAPSVAQMSNSMAEPSMTNPPTASEHGSSTMAHKQMSSADMKKWDACMAMTPEAMMKDSKCMKMKKMHDDMAKNKGM